MRTARFLKFSAVVCMTAMFLSAVAEAQQQGRGGRQRGGQPGGRGGFGQRSGFGGGRGGFQPSVSRAVLLGVEDVQDELSIDDTQHATITAALEAYRQERDDSRPERSQFDRSQFENATDEERQALREKMEKERDELNKKREALNKKTDQMLATLLEPEQVKRLDQIALQVRVRFGLVAVLKSPEMRDKLSITDEQIVKLEKVEEDALAARRKMFENMRSGDGERPDFSKIGEMMAEARKESEKNVLAVVTDEQKAILASMKGAAFEFDMRALQRGGGRGGFGGGDRGRGRGEGGDRRRGDGGERRRPAADSDDAI